MSAVVSFFPVPVPEAPGAALDHYKRTLRDAQPSMEAPQWRLDPGNAGLLARGVGELAARGVRKLDVVLPAEDLTDDETVVADEPALVPILRRLRDRLPAGFDLRYLLSVGRPYILPPPSLDISTNDLCGLECVMCANRNDRRDPLTLAPREVADLIREAAAWGVPRVALTGAGEPFRDPHMLSHMRLAHDLGLLVTVTSNGFPITESLAAELAGMRASLSISLHAAKDETEDHITGVRGSAVRAWTAIRRLAAARDRAGARGRMFVSVSTVIQRDNVEEVLDLVHRSHQEGCDGHNLQPVNLQHGTFRAGEVLRRDDVALMARLWPTTAQADALDRLFDGLVDFRRRHRHIRTPEDRLRLFRRYFADSSRESLQVACRVGEWFLGIDHRGRVKPCYRLPWSLGDARNRPVRRLWNSRAYAEVRRTVDACPLTCMNNCFFRS